MGYFQTDVLNYVGQQLIAHAALIFATLTAVFTFTITVDNKTLEPAERCRHLFRGDGIKFPCCNSSPRGMVQESSSLAGVATLAQREDFEKALERLRDQRMGQKTGVPSRTEL